MGNDTPTKEEIQRVQEYLAGVTQETGGVISPEELRVTADYMKALGDLVQALSHLVQSRVVRPEIEQVIRSAAIREREVKAIINKYLYGVKGEKENEDN